MIDDNIRNRGFGLSNDEVKLFKACAAHQNKDQLENLANSFCHFNADYVNNTVRVTGNDCFHVMGLMCAATPPIAIFQTVIRNSKYFKTEPKIL